MFRSWAEYVAAVFARKYKTGILHGIFAKYCGPYKMRDINKTCALTFRSEAAEIHTSRKSWRKAAAVVLHNVGE